MADVIEYKSGGATVRVEGLRDVQRKLNRAGADAEDMKDLMSKLGQIVVDGSRPPRRSGALAGTIRAGRAKSRAVVRAGLASVPYAGVIHWGWPARNIRSQPFLTDALRTRHEQIYGALERGIDKMLADNGLK